MICNYYYCDIKLTFWNHFPCRWFFYSENISCCWKQYCGYFMFLHEFNVIVINFLQMRNCSCSNFNSHNTTSHWIQFITMKIDCQSNFLSFIQNLFRFFKFENVFFVKDINVLGWNQTLFFQFLKTFFFFLVWKNLKTSNLIRQSIELSRLKIKHLKKCIWNNIWNK